MICAFRTAPLLDHLNGAEFTGNVITTRLNNHDDQGSSWHRGGVATPRPATSYYSLDISATKGLLRPLYAPKISVAVNLLPMHLSLPYNFVLKSMLL